TGGVLPKGLIRLRWRRFRGQNRLQGAVIAVSVRVKPVGSACARLPPEIYLRQMPANVRGSTRMGRSTQQVRRDFGRFWLSGLLAAACLLGLTGAASAQGAVRS